MCGVAMAIGASIAVGKTADKGLPESFFDLLR